MQLFAAAFGATNSNNNSLANIGSVKVLVVGAQGVGKSSLVSCLAGAGTGTDPGPRPSTSAPPPTRGCNVVVKLVQNAGGKAGQQFFAELWDVGADARYADLRQLFYDGVAGVMLVYDASSPKSRKAVSQWAREVAQNGSFVAPSEGMAARNIGGLPVPVRCSAKLPDNG